MKLFIRNYSSILLLFLIILLGLTLRIYKLDEVPAGFFADEASIGYNAYTIGQYGKDEFGNKFPIYFKAFGEYKNPVQIYSTTPFVMFFGLNEFTVRIASVFFSIISIIGVHVLSRCFVGSKFKSSVGLLSALFLAISPWHLHVSRISLEAFMPFVAFTILGTYFFINKSKLGLLISSMCFILAIYSYFPSRIFIPLYLIALSLIYAKKLIKNWKKTSIVFILATVLLIPFILHSLSPNGLDRWKMVNIFDNSTHESPIIHISNNYLSHFSLDFLFLKGDIDMPGQFITRHSVRGFGELYLFQLPFILLGGAYFIIKKNYKHFLLLLSWLLLYPLGSAFTLDKSAQATRSIIGVVPYQILTAIGIRYLFSLVKSSLIKIVLFALVAFAIIFLLTKYLYALYFSYPLYSSDYWGWQYGFKQSMDTLDSYNNKYDSLLITHRFNRGETLLKFYQVEGRCNTCQIATNPITVDLAKKQLFALRTEDIVEVETSYDYAFKEVNAIIAPNGQKEIFIGYFTE